MLINKIQSNYLNNNNYIKSNNSERVSRPAFPFFGCAIPRDKLKNLGYKYLTEIEGTRDEKSVYAIVKEYYYSKVLPLVAPKKGKVYEDNDLLHLFRHELVNQTGSPLELNINPEYKQMALEMAGFPKRVKYVSHQKKVFREIVGQINRLANRWGKIEDWKENPHKTVQFSELRKVLGSMNGIAETKGVNVIITDSIPEGKYTKHAFDLYNLLSQVILNGIKYAKNRPVYINLAKAKNGANTYSLTVLNDGTKAIPDADIDRILLGDGYRGAHNDIQGTGTGYKEIIRILTEQNKGSEIPNLIEKGRRSGVKVTVPFDLNH